MIDFYHYLQSPLKGEQEQPGSLNNYDWQTLTRDVKLYLSQGQDSARLHVLMQPFYVEFIEARLGATYYLNKNWAKASFVWKVFELDEHAGEWISNHINIPQITDTWIDSNVVDANTFRHFLTSIGITGFHADWNLAKKDINERLQRLEVDGGQKTGKDVGEYYCSFHGFCMIMGAGLVSSKKNELLDAFEKHWDLFRFIYSVMVRCVVGCNYANIVAVAHHVENIKGYAPYLHLFHAPLKERFSEFCDKGCKPEKLSKAITKIEHKMQQTEPSYELDELCEILFPQEFREMLDRHRPKSYQELERELFEKGEEMKNTVELLNQQAKAMATQLKTLMDNSVPISQIENELLRLPAMGAYNVWLQLNGLLAANEAWKSKAVNIRDKILAKQQQEMQMSMTITAQAGSNVNGVVQQQANYSIEPNRQIPS